MRGRSRAGWTELIREWREGGLSAKEFATAKQVTEKTLVWWASRLKREAKMAPPRPVEFVEITPPAMTPSERFEVHLGNGRWIVVPSSFDGGALARLMSVVGATR
jgi:hypothetical protein